MEKYVFVKTKLIGLKLIMNCSSVDFLCLISLKFPFKIVNVVTICIGRLASIIGRLASIIGRLASIIGRLASIIGRLASIIGRLASIIGRLASIIGRLASIIGRLASIIGRLASIIGRLASIIGRLARMSVSGYRGRRFAPRQQYVVSLSKTLYPHCFS